MDILRELSLLMEQDLGDLRDKPPEYRRRSDQLAALIQEIADKVGEELMGKYWAMEADQFCDEALTCFLWGLRLGVELLRL